MLTVNLKDLYYWYKEDILVEITEEMLEAMKAADSQEAAYKRRTYRYKAHYTLDMGDSLDNERILKPATPAEIYLKEEPEREIEAAISGLTEVQRRRVKQYYFKVLRHREIVAIENVKYASVGSSIHGALKKLGKLEQIKGLLK